MKRVSFLFILLALIIVSVVSCDNVRITGKTYVVTVGDDYYGGNNGKRFYLNGQYLTTLAAPELETPLNDCKAVSEQVKALDSNAVVFNFINTGAVSSYTWSDVSDYIKGLPIGENDLLILFYSGHGMSDVYTTQGKSDVLRGWLCTRYSDGYELISPEKVLGTLSSVPGYKVFMSDSCYAGRFVVDSTLEDAKTYNEYGTYFTSSSPANSFIASFRAFNVNPSYRQKYPDTWALTAVTGNTQSPEDPPYGLLTECILQYLGAEKSEDGYYHGCSDNAGKTLSLYEMYRYSFNRYSENGYIESYTPLVTGSAEDVILFGR